MSPLQELEGGERLKQKTKKNKIGQGQVEGPGSGTSGTSGSTVASRFLEASSSNSIVQAAQSVHIYPEVSSVRPARSRESWQPQVPWLRDDFEKPRNEDGRGKQRNARSTRNHERKEQKHDTWVQQEWQHWQSQSQHKEWQRPRPSYEPKRSETSSPHSDWSGYVQVSSDGLLNIRLARLGLNVQSLKSFCAWLPTELHRLKQAKARRLYVSTDDIVLAHDVDLSQNDLDDEAMRILLLTLKQARVVIGVAKFYQNRFGCRSAILLSQWIRSAPWALFELHLSHNNIKTAGALELIKAIAETKSYPSARPGSKNWPLPLWLRLEHNDIPEADCFERKAELCLQAARPEAKGKLICWFVPKNLVGCRSDNCGHSTADHCPVIHIPHLRPETRKGNAPARMASLS